MATKKVPQRMCLACREMKAKKELVRIVKSANTKDEEGNEILGEISVDLTGKKSGRGAYICKDINCLKMAEKRKSLERAFSCAITKEIYQKLGEAIDG